MINKDVSIDFNNKIISHKLGAKKIYKAVELYVYLMDVFDDPENMRYDIPMEAETKSRFKLINGWSMDLKTRQYFTGIIS